MYFLRKPAVLNKNVRWKVSPIKHPWYSEVSLELSLEELEDAILSVSCQN